LADELEEAWDEDEGVDNDDSSQLDGSLRNPVTPPRSPLKYDINKIRDSGVEVESSPSLNSSLPTSPKHRRKPSRSKHGRHNSTALSVEELELEEGDDISKPLDACLRDIEWLAKPAIEPHDSIPEDTEPRDPILQLESSLKEVGAQQSGFETSTTRLATAHLSIAMHLTNAARVLQNLTQYLASPLSSVIAIEDGEMEDLQDVLTDAVASVPRPTAGVLSGLNHLHGTSKEAIDCLSSLSDSLHLARQESATAARRLKGTREMVAQLRLESRQAEEGTLWLERGDWNRRLMRRDCSAACRDIVGGFEEACEDWRNRLLNGLGGKGTVA